MALLPFLPAAGGAIVNFLGGIYGQKEQQANNMELAQYQNRQNLKFWRMNNRYNTPAAQMQRYLDAGLNPNLIYGQGSPGNATSPTAADIKPADIQSVYSNLGTNFQQSRLLAAQADLTRQKTTESGTKSELNQAQKDLVKANPYMRSEYVNALVTQLQSVARLKEQQASFMTSYMEDKDGKRGETGFLIMEKEIELLYQKYNLGQADQKLKAEVLQSKEFQNSILEVQKKWMTESDITPQHIYQGILLLLSRMM